MDVGDLVAKLQAISQNNPERRIFVRGDKDLAYGRIMEVMGTITQGGFTKVALLAEQTAAPPAGTCQACRRATKVGTAERMDSAMTMCQARQLPVGRASHLPVWQARHLPVWRARHLPVCHGRAWPGHPRLYCEQHRKSWMAGPSPAMTPIARLATRIARPASQTLRPAALVVSPVTG